jgi:hypothetical protein
MRNYTYYIMPVLLMAIGGGCAILHDYFGYAFGIWVGTVSILSTTAGYTMFLIRAAMRFFA